MLPEFHLSVYICKVYSWTDIAVMKVGNNIMCERARGGGRDTEALKWRRLYSNPLQGNCNGFIHFCERLSLAFSLKKAAGIINELESEKFGKLLARIIQKLHLKVWVLQGPLNIP